MAVGPEDITMRVAKVVGPYADIIATSLLMSLLAALGGVVRALRLGKCGAKAVTVAAISSAFAGVIVHLILDQTNLPMSMKAAMVGVSGYASGELLKIMTARMCKWAEKVEP